MGRSGSSRKSKRWLLAVVLLVSVAVGLVVAELVLRQWFTAKMADAGVPCGDWDEDYTRLQYAYALKAGQEPEMPSEHYVYDAHRGYKLAPNLRGLDQYGGEVNSNSIGARGVAEVSAEKRPGVTRIVAIGDSFTFGEGVTDDQTWPAHLQSLLPDSEVVNLGASAYAHDQMYFALVDDGLPLHPDIVVLGFYLGDMTRNLRSFFCYEKPRFAQPDGGGGAWEVENLPIPTKQEVYDEHIDTPLVWALTRAVLARSFAGPPDENPSAVTTHILDEIVARTHEAGARMVMVYLPSWDDTDPTLEPGCGFFCDYCRSHEDVECVDPRPRMKALREQRGDEPLRDEWYFDDGGGHPKGPAYRIMAETLRDRLADTSN